MWTLSAGSVISGTGGLAAMAKAALSAEAVLTPSLATTRELARPAIEMRRVDLPGGGRDMQRQRLEAGTPIELYRISNVSGRLSGSLAVQVSVMAPVTGFDAFTSATLLMFGVLAATACLASTWPSLSRTICTIRVPATKATACPKESAPASPDARGREGVVGHRLAPGIEQADGVRSGRERRRRNVAGLVADVVHRRRVVAEYAAVDHQPVAVLLRRGGVQRRR